mmetsp:Transcript_21676/g.61720  ORF Transcript_21676/g.61720 Transcript_21676/m.61720 type:complete len:241 (-) Transcript_21676:2850-3572(-)
MLDRWGRYARIDPDGTSSRLGAQLDLVLCREIVVAIRRQLGLQEHHSGVVNRVAGKGRVPCHITRSSLFDVRVVVVVAAFVVKVGAILGQQSAFVLRFSDARIELKVPARLCDGTVFSALLRRLGRLRHERRRRHESCKGRCFRKVNERKVRGVDAWQEVFHVAERDVAAGCRERFAEAAADVRKSFVQVRDVVARRSQSEQVGVDAFDFVLDRFEVWQGTKCVGDNVHHGMRQANLRQL